MKKETINKQLPVELTFTPDFQDKQFTVTGDYESVAPLYDRLASSDARRSPTSAATARIGETTISAMKRPVEALVGRVAVDVKAKAYDIRNRTDFYGALRAKRQLEKDLAMAASLGLLTVEPCLKHRVALEAVKQVR